MDVRINNLTSNIHMQDARAMLTPEVLQQITEAVLLRLRQEAEAEQARRHDEQIEHRATKLDA
jgi:hypothetical protein